MFLLTILIYSVRQSEAHLSQTRNLLHLSHQNLLVIWLASREKLGPSLPWQNKQGQDTGTGFQHGLTFSKDIPKHSRNKVKKALSFNSLRCPQRDIHCSCISHSVGFTEKPQLYIVSKVILKD